MITVVNCHYQTPDIYCGRPHKRFAGSPLANPFPMASEADRGRVIVLDLDPQGNASQTLLKIPVGESAQSPTLYDALYSLVMDRRNIIEAGAIKAIGPGLDLLPANQQMESFKDLLKSKSRRAVEVLKTLLKPVTGQYDHLIIDCPADLSVYVENAIEMSDRLILPTTYDLYGLSGLALVIPLLLEIKGDDFDTYRVLYTMHNARATKIKADIGTLADELEQAGFVLPFKIPADQSVKNSQARNADLIADPAYRSSQARQAYTNLGEYILDWSSQA